MAKSKQKKASGYPASIFMIQTYGEEIDAHTDLELKGLLVYGDLEKLAKDELLEDDEAKRTVAVYHFVGFREVQIKTETKVTWRDVKQPRKGGEKT